MGSTYPNQTLLSHYRTSFYYGVAVLPPVMAGRIALLLPAVTVMAASFICGRCGIVVLA